MKSFLNYVKGLLLGGLALAALCLGQATSVQAEAHGPRAKPLVLRVNSPDQVGAVVRQAAATEADTLHVIIAVGHDEARPDMAQGFGRDAEVLEKALKDAFAKAGMSHRLKLKVLQGDDANPEKVREHIAQLPVGANDSVLFYWTGHGGIGPEGHALCFWRGRPGILYRAELRRLLEAKRPRMLSIVTDCCSNYPGVQLQPAKPGPTPVVGRQAVTATDARSLNWETLRALFLRPRGIVDITAAQDGMTSTSVEGLGLRGAFSEAFLQLLAEPLSRVNAQGKLRACWKPFFLRLQQRTQKVLVEWKQRVYFPRCFEIREWPAQTPTTGSSGSGRP
jgi:hypothetical protein